MTLHKPPYCAKSLGAQIDRMVVGLRAKKQGKNIADMSGSNKWFNRVVEHAHYLSILMRFGSKLQTRLFALLCLKVFAALPNFSDCIDPEENSPRRRVLRRS